MKTKVSGAENYFVVEVKEEEGWITHMTGSYADALQEFNVIDVKGFRPVRMCKASGQVVRKQKNWGCY